MRPRTIRAHRAALWAFLAGCSVAGAAPAGPDAAWKLPPDRRAAVEALGATLIAAINAPDDAARARLIHEAYAPEEIAEATVERIGKQLVAVGAQFPGLRFDRAELVEVLRGSGASRVLHVYARRPGDKIWRDLQVRVSAREPHRLTKLVFIAEVTEPIALPNGGISSPETLEWLGRYIDRLERVNGLSGSALIAVGDRVVFERYFGHADAARTRTVTAETRFSLASASKMFTALGIARLVAGGTVSYADTLDRYFPDFPDAAFARRATIGNLLSHTSGVGEYWTEEHAEALRKVRTTADVLPLVYEAGVRFEPGTQYAYSNSNFILAGLILERVTERPFEESIREWITSPLGMTETGPFDTTDASLPLAQALVREGDGWAAAPRAIRGTAAGGWFSTPRDMLRFVRGLQAGRIVPGPVLAEMVSSKTRGLGAEDYGYGFILERHGQVDSYGHGGIARGVNAEIRFFPSLDATLILFSNQDNGAYDDLRKNATRLITGER
jgi:CubicO group peptidase (beta-lactamase class C family)